MELGQALYVKRAEPKDLRTRPPDHMIERMLEEVGIQAGPPRKTTYANPFFNEIQCGKPNELTYRAKSLAEEFPTLGDDCQALGPHGNKPFCYQLSVAKCAWIIYHLHFGFRTALRPQDVLVKGVEMAIAYFAAVSHRLAKTANVGRTEDVAWFEPYSQALLLATLAGSSRQRALLSGVP